MLYQFEVNSEVLSGERENIMKNFRLLLIVSTWHCVFSYYLKNRQDFRVNNFINPVESYVGPSSYTTSYSTSNINDYPSVGNFGSLMNTRNPQITSSYSSYGISDSGELESTSYINYPPQTTTVIHGESPKQPNPQALSQNAFSTSNFNLFSHPNFSNSPSQNSQFNYQIPQDFASLISSTFDNYANNINLPPPSSEVISEHVEVTKPVVVPVYKKFPYPQAKHFPVAIPHPILVPVPAPYPVNVVISEPVAVPILKELRVPVEREVMYPVHKSIPVEVERPLKFKVEKHYPIYVPKPYPVKIPIVKTVIHKAPKKWSRDVNDAQEKTFTIKKSPMKKMH